MTPEETFLRTVGNAVSIRRKKTPDPFKVSHGRLMQFALEDFDISSPSIEDWYLAYGRSWGFSETSDALLALIKQVQENG